MRPESPSLLGRITRYARTPGRDAREDRLTEVLAAMLERPELPGLTEALVRRWLMGEAAGTQASEILGRLGRGGVWRTWVKTQRVITVPSGETRRIDLEVTLRSDEAPDPIVVWLEVKHGAAPEREQLVAYVEAQLGLSGHIVVLLAPRRDLPSFHAAQIPASVPTVTWEETADEIKRYRHTRVQDLDGIGIFLLDELDKYLTEEDLVDPGAFTERHAAALESFREADRALDALCSKAATAITQSIGWSWEPGRYPDRGIPQERWFSLVGSSGPNGLGNLGWSAITDANYLRVNGEAGQARFIVNVSTNDPAVLAQLAPDAIDRLADREFVILRRDQTNSKNEYIIKERPLSDLVGLDEDEQVQVLSDWVVAELRSLDLALWGNRTLPTPPHTA